MYTTVTQYLDQGYPTCDPPERVMRLAPTFINYISNVKITQQLSRLSVPFTVIFTLQPSMTGAAVCPKRIWTPLIKALKASLKHSVMCLLTEAPSRLTQ